ncbi:hypothetical protein RFI_02907 [Reticulomyxa filosa]|uniref:Kelch motif family protein n=1 Tax=Reticulomyxa filosa TaxID=46433 RepID=X6P971_RETFI|nr:hypothetical protein RFI_02907 [Reticulomyxa filosa]|eukprot:ETO34187.1 hypothetical protein RFI_02907 [Reticulomyxa filosa]
MGNQTFQTLKRLPIPISRSQCVLHKHELLICGGYEQRACYSYHTVKNEYKFICRYPSDIKLNGHCVVKLVNKNNNKDNNEITLLSFGSSSFGENKHTLVMKYVSVWSNISNKSNILKNYNQWIPFTDNQNHPIIIGRDGDSYIGVRAVIGGSNNHLLFITYWKNDISVFDLNTFQFIKHNTLPTNTSIFYHCFVSNLENRQGQEMMKTNKQNCQMLLFCGETGLSIEYDEDNNTFQFHQLPVCDDIAPFKYYAYVCINDIIIFLVDAITRMFKLVHKYSIRENKWVTFRNTLTNPLFNCVAILSEEHDYIHIIGGKDDKEATVSAHMKTKVCVWDPSQLVMICLFTLMKHK